MIKKSVEEKRISDIEKGNRETKKVHIFSKVVPSQVEKNLLGGVQKSYIYNCFFK